jgi:hypothetical protein
MPLIFLPLIAWFVEQFGSFAAKKAYKLAAALVFIAGMVASVAALVALVSIVPSPPASISATLGYLMPADWASQLAIIVSARAYSLVWYSWREAFKIAVNS